MDDIFMNVFLKRFMQRPIGRKLFADFSSFLETCCDHCKTLTSPSYLNKCVFCDKIFCRDCAENKRVCKVCNFNIVANVNFQILNRFSLKELRLLSDNYDISIDRIVEKEQLIEAILVKFKKSFDRSYDKSVDVDELRRKMIELQIEEDTNKERLLQEETKRTILLSKYAKAMGKKEEVFVKFKAGDVLNITAGEAFSLSVRKMKELLNRYNIDYTNVVEKKELISLVEQLCCSYKKFKDDESNTPTSDTTSECGICMDNVINCAFIACGHSMCCYDCGKKIVNCPLCRKEISQCLKIYFS